MIRNIAFEGLQAVEMTTDKLRLVAITEFGPRIAFLGKPGGRNLLLWKPETYTYQDWDLRGGHRVWMTRPMADECEDTYAADNGPCDTEITDNGFRLTGAVNPSNKTRRGVEITLTSESAVEVNNFCTNAGDFLYSGGLWVLTCTVPGPQTRYATPVGDGSSWDTMAMVYYRRWATHGQAGFDDAQVDIRDDVVILTPKGKEMKRMIQAPAGVLVMSDPDEAVTFAKQAAFIPGAPYPMNCNTAYYIGPDNFMVEMETMSPEQTLRPGATMSHTESWQLLDTALPMDSGAALLKALA